MVLGVVDKADTIVLDHNEKLDSWAVVLNGHVERTLPDSSLKSYHVGDHFGVDPILDTVYHEGVMKTKCDDCQFVLVKQNDYYEILNQSKENTKPYYEGGKLVMVTEYRLLNNTSDKTGEIVLRANPDKLIERLVNDDSNSLVDPTFIQDFLLTYRVFIDAPTFISNKLCEWFEQSSNSLTLSSLAAANLKKKVYRIVLEWITNHFNDFETNKELYDFVERFQEILSKEKMHEQLRVLTIALSTKSKQRTLTLARSKRDEQLMFSIQGGWDKGYGVFISRVEKETKAGELGVRKGDQILEVNGHSFQHITLSSAIETLKSFTHSSITLKYNPIGFNEMLLHPEKSPHRNKKNFVNNRAYLIEYLQMQESQIGSEQAWVIIIDYYCS
jgi:Rap guanine nucleotide exchange factor 2